MVKKNNKGFTLVEVIAVVALLGILTVLVVPRIFDLITDSRKDIYVQDAIRLISQAQYTMNSKSVKIEKPDSGEVIVFSMKFLSIDDFQSPPNGGTYLPESSFVIVKNVRGEYIYSVMLVEQTKRNQYMGVELSTESALNAKDATKHVRIFQENEIAYIDSSVGNLNGGLVINSAFINDFIKLGEDDSASDWNVGEDDIIGYYNNEKDEDEEVSNTSAPKITAKFSTIGGSLKTTLNISAKDADNDLKDLKVFIKISKNKDDTYPDPTRDAFEMYGNENVYSKDIDFEQYDFSYQKKETAYVFILVMDPNGNYTRKRISYEVHENEPPRIEVYTISNSVEGSNKNLPRAKVHLEVTDDMLSQSDVNVCFTQDKSQTTCSDYHKYSTYFDTNGNYYYTFKDGNGKDIVEPDGNTYYLKVFVRDHMNKTVDSSKSYTLYKNTPPGLSIQSFVTECLKNSSGACFCTSGKCNNLTVGVNINVSDDLTPVDNLTVTMYELDGTTKVGAVTMPYSTFKLNTQEFTFSGGYDGQKRTLYVDLTDEYGKTTTKSRDFTTVYEDQPPTIRLTKNASGNEVPFITSYEAPCSGSNTCSDESYGGSYHAKLNFEVSDDITNVNNLLVCVSKNKADCATYSADKFKKYSDFDMDYNFAGTGEAEVYDGSSKTLYASVADEKHHVTTLNGPSDGGFTYKIYNNQKPKISGKFFMVPYNPGEESAVDNLEEVIVSLKENTDTALKEVNVEDDFEDYKARFCYSVDGGEDICSDYMSFDDLKIELSNPRELKDNDDNVLRYYGQTIHSRIDVQDNYGEEASLENKSDYVMYRDTEPVIKSAELQSSTPDYNSYMVNLLLNVEDKYDEYQVCVTDKSSCEDDEFMSNANGSPFAGRSPDDAGEEYMILIDGHDLANWDEEYRDPDVDKKLNVFVKDTYGNISSTKLDYELYKLCSIPSKMDPTDDDVVYDVVSNAISTSYCNGACYHNVENTTNTSHVNHFQDVNTLFGTYRKQITYMDTLVGITCPIYSEEKKYCDYVDCFNTFPEETEPVEVTEPEECDDPESEDCEMNYEEEPANPNLISMKLEEENKLWYYSNSHVTRKVEKDKPYCDDVTTNSRFTKYDDRCADAEITCQSYATATCQAEAEQFNNLMAAYEQAEKTALKNQLVIDFPDDTDDITSCISLALHYDDDEWIETQGTYCKIGGTMSSEQQAICNVFTANSSDPEGPYIVDSLCTNLEQKKAEDNKTYATHRRNFISSYESNHPKPQQGTCYSDKMTECRSFYSFCDNNSLSDVYKVVSCDPNASNYVTPDLTVHCSLEDYTKGYCLTDTTATCESVTVTDEEGTSYDEETNCQRVCYKRYDCSTEYEFRPVTFTCHGYYKVYQSVKRDHNILLQETSLRICPDFLRLFPSNEYDFYKYNDSDTYPFIRFNPSEIEVMP